MRNEISYLPFNCVVAHTFSVVYLPGFSFDCNAFTQLNWPFGFNSIVSFVTPFSLLLTIFFSFPYWYLFGCLWKREKSAVWMNNVPCTNSIIWLRTERMERRRTNKNKLKVDEKSQQKKRASLHWRCSKSKITHWLFFIHRFVFVVFVWLVGWLV